MKKIMPWFRDSSIEFQEDGQNSVDLEISLRGAVVLWDGFKLSDLICTDTDNENNRLPAKNKEVAQTRENDKRLPGINDLIGLKGEITLLTQRETELSGPVRLEFRRQLSDIRNLFRLISSDILNPKNKNPRHLRVSAGSEVLNKNWDKMRTSMLIAGSYCE